MKRRDIYTRVVILFCIMTIVLFAAFKNFEKFFTTNVTHVVSYTNDGSVDYKVNLKPNDYYDEDYLDKGYLYIATLIDDIDFNFHYKFSLEEQAKLNYKYKILATVFVKGDDSDSLLYEKKYDLTKFKKNSVEAKEYSINEPLTIKYDDYNKIIKDFKKEYALNSNSVLRLSLVVDTEVASKEFKKNKNSYESVNVEIPLTEQTINIVVDTDNQKSIGHFSEDSTDNLINYAYLSVFVLLMIIVIILILQIFRFLKILQPENYEYLRKVNSIKKQYDRFIVDVDKLPDLKEPSVFDVGSFEELLDARDNLQRPILYKELEPGRKSCFIIISNDECYRYVADFYEMKKGSKKGKKK